MIDIINPTTGKPRYYRGEGTDVKSSAEIQRKRNVNSNPERMYVNGKYVPNTHPLYKQGRYKSFGDAAFASLSNYTKSKEGDVYVIVNKAWDGWVKIGMAVDAEDRLNSYQTSSPFRDYVLLHKVFFNDRRTAEGEAHILADTVAEERRGEWFKMSSYDAVKVLSKVDNQHIDVVKKMTKVFNPKDKHGYYK
jgi:hypothetical protein